MPLDTTADVARLFKVKQSYLLWVLYKADVSVRYRHFEILKRSGGMRLISAPHGLVRELQTAMLPMLVAAYDAHPAAHGFIAGRNVASNAAAHVGRRWVLNVDIEDFFPSINFGRVRGLFMHQPFNMGPKAAAVCAQICTYNNGLPQGAPTSPVISNFVATALDKQLLRLAKQNRLAYSRYADDITLSAATPEFPAVIASYEIRNGQALVRAGEELERVIAANGFRLNARKVRLQGPHVRKTVTGLTVNVRVNVERERIRRIRAMIHAWGKFGLDAAGSEHFAKHRRTKRRQFKGDAGAAFRNVLYGELAYVKMIRGADDPTFLRLCAKLVTLDPNPSRFIRQMVFGAADYDVFISHASEDKAAIARPIFEACEALGLKAFLDEEHIGWGQSFTAKINTALGAARTVLAIVSPTSVGKEWPVAEVNTALSLDVTGEKVVLPLIVGKPDLSRLPLIRGKDQMVWSGDARAVALRLAEIARGRGESSKASARRERAASETSVPQTSRRDTGAGRAGMAPRAPRRGLWQRMFGRSDES